MATVDTLVLAGGEVHDFHGCGQAISDALVQTDEFALTYVEENLNVLLAPHLTPFDLLIFYYTLGEITDAQKNGLLNWLAAGKAFVGVHSAAVSFCACPEYRAMLGRDFVSHPPYRQYQVSVVDPEHPITKDLVEFTVTDEQYILDYDPRVQVLCSALYQGQAVPVAWLKPWGDGHVFYLALGHDEPACRDEHFQLLLQRGARHVGQSQISQA